MNVFHALKIKWFSGLWFRPLKQNLKHITQWHSNDGPIWNLSPFHAQVFQVKTYNSNNNIPYLSCSLFTEIPKAIPPVVSKWMRTTESERHFLCLFQIHSREMLTKSISLPRSAYWQHITRQNSVGDLYSYQGTGMRLLIIICKLLLFFYLHVSG